MSARLASVPSKVYSLKGGELKVTALGKADTRALSLDRKKLYDLSGRDSGTNAAQLEFMRPVAEGLDFGAVAEAGANASLEQVAVFRARQGNAKGSSLELLILRARRENGRILLEEPIDSRAFGSPLLVAEGLLGMLQNHTVGTSMKRLRQELLVVPVAK
ncbi:MAG: hypothetical protein WKF37_09320 [Bryobacteraceae bacterium]